MIFQVPLDRIIPNTWQTRQINLQHAKELAFNPRRGIAHAGLDQPPLARLVDSECRLVPLDVGESILQGDGVSWQLMRRGPARGMMRVLERYGWWVQLAFGHHRWQAFLLARQRHGERFEYMPVQLQDLNDQEMAMKAYGENEDRADLTPIEEARAMQRMMDDFGWTQQELGERLGVSRSTVAVKLRLLRVDEDVQQAVEAGEISERTAQAMVALSSLPEPARRYIDRLPGYALRPDEILRRARDGWDSDQVRNVVDRLIEQVTASLDPDELMWPMEYDFNRLNNGMDGMQHARCSECRTKLRRRGEMRCADRECMDRKVYLWMHQKLAFVEAALGIPARSQTEEAEGYESYELFSVGGDHRDLLEQLMHGDGCPYGNLRLVTSSFSAARYEGINSIPPGVRVVCQHGAGRHCMCLAALRRQRTRERNERERAGQQQVREQVIRPAVHALTEAMAAGDRAAWLLILQHTTNRWDFPADTDLAEILGELATTMVQAWIKAYWAMTDVAQARGAIESKFGAAGLPVPSLGELADMERRLERIVRFLEAGSDQDLSLEALRGNEANLKKLREKLRSPDGQVATGDRRVLQRRVDEALADVRQRMQACLEAAALGSNR